MAASWSTEYFSVPQEAQRYEQSSDTTAALGVEVEGEGELMTGAATTVATCGVVTCVLFGLTAQVRKRRVHQKVAAAVITTAVLSKVIKLVCERQTVDAVFRNGSIYRGIGPCGRSFGKI